VDSSNRTPEIPSSAGASEPVIARAEAKSLRDLSPAQWKSGIAAWLGWLFDGLDMHLYGLVAAPFVAHLINTTDLKSRDVTDKTSWIQASFLVGWALGGGFFGRVGDLIGRSRALSLTILVYAAFTGLSFFAQTWWQLLIFRFISALGIGGEWAVGSALLSETWPRKWGPWIAAVLQTGVNIGVLMACAAVGLNAKIFKGHPSPEKFVFLVGLLPALIVFWIRRNVPEPEEWHAARKRIGAKAPRVSELFHGKVLRTTILTILVCACSLTAWWAFMFWHVQHIRNLDSVATWTKDEVEFLVSAAFFLVIAASIAGNFFSGWLAKMLGYRRAIALDCLGFFIATSVTFWVPRDHVSMLWCIPFVGFFSGVFGLFTMYMPPLFPVLLRTTGAGFCYNIGRIAAAAGTVYFGLLNKVGDFRTPLFYAGFLFLPAMVVAWFMPDHDTEVSARGQLDIRKFQVNPKTE
jgi:MFS family permease